MKMRKLFAGLAAAATLLSGMAWASPVRRLMMPLQLRCYKLTMRRKAIRTHRTSLPRLRILAMGRSK